MKLLLGLVIILICLTAFSTVYDWGARAKIRELEARVLILEGR